MAITVEYSVLAQDYRISGDASSGYKATVPYVVAWEDAFSFVNQMLGRTTAAAVGPITYFLPYRLPTTGGVSLYAQGFEIEPCGASGGAIPNKGLIPGSDFFFTHAKVTIQFAQPETVFQDQGQDPQNLQQLDPDKPIPCCTQSVKSKGKIVTRKGGGYEFVSDSKPLAGDFGERVVESSLTLKFPKVPYMPWGLIRPYLNCVNDAEFLQCPRGTLLLEDLDTELELQTDGTLSQSVVLAFKHQVYDWNKFPRPDNGELALVRIKGSSDYVYQYEDFQEVIDALSYSTVANES